MSPPFVTEDWGILALPDIPSLVAENHRNPLAPITEGGTIS